MGESQREKGKFFEDRFKKFFGANDAEDICYDFETKNVLWEVKTCEVLNHYGEGNGARPNGVFRKGRTTSHNGRFVIDPENHARLKSISDRKNKEAKYLFVITYENQCIYKVVPWDQVKIAEGVKQAKISWIHVFSKEVLYASPLV